uniref:CHK kinase-like domain-containing protein n=1 Tax=Stomoxys calcitrans TaxID=35570 RepID=A0A1I8NXU0_STOCA
MESNAEDNFGIISKKDCLTIVKNYLKLTDEDEVQVLAYEVSRASSDCVGFIGEYYKLKMEIQEKKSNEAQTLKFFVKSAPITNASLGADCERKALFVKESEVYKQILPNIQRYAEADLYPKSYLMRSNVIVLEDFSLAEKNLKQMKEGEEHTIKHYQLFLQLLAKLHASSLAWELKESIDINKQFKHILFDQQFTSTNEWYTTGIKGLLYLTQSHPQFQYPEAQEFINNKLCSILNHLEEYVNPSKTLRNVLCHRDSWTCNIFWEYNQETQELIGCRIIDFQLMRYSPPAIDVLNFLYNTYHDPVLREKEIPQHLKYYRMAFRQELKRLELPEDIIPDKEFEEDCQRALLPIRVLRAICVPLMKLPHGWADMMRATNPKTFDIYMNSDRREMFERISSMDSTYRAKILYPVQEIMEYFGFKARA